MAVSALRVRRNPVMVAPVSSLAIYTAGTMVFFFSFFTAVIAVFILRRLALIAGFVDKPGGRKQHETPVPAIGGVAIFLTFLAFVVTLGMMPWAFYAALALILIVGVVDDGWSMNSHLKFLIHFLAAFILVIGGGAQIETLGNILGFGELHLGIFSIPFSVACVVYILNAVNMMDGMDGLAGGNSFIIFGWLAFAAAMLGNSDALIAILLLMGAIAGFLVFNLRTPFRKHASVFLGDAGSMALGLMIAWFSITLSQQDPSRFPPVSVAWIIALPIIDAFGLLVARLRDGKPPFEADRRHFHHHFLHAGCSPSMATPLILLWSFLLGAVGFVGIRSGILESVLGWAWIALWWGHALLVIKHQKFIDCLTALRRKIPHQS